MSDTARPNTTVQPGPLPAGGSRSPLRRLAVAAAGVALLGALLPVSGAVGAALLGQTISFTSSAPTGATVGAATYIPTASATSGLPVALTIDGTASAVCAITYSGVVSLTGVGSCVIDANQAGNGTYSAAAQVQQSFTVSVAVVNPISATAIAAGGYHTCALLTSGGVDCWGLNLWGQLGNGTLTDSSTPVAVSGITTATAIAAGYDHTCALLAGGGVDCWGFNNYGQLGNGTLTDSSIPVAVTGITGATAIAAGGGQDCALLASGSVDCWGWNAYGQLGNGTRNDSSTPVAVSGITGATAIAAGFYHTCALLTGGSVECWGNNASGELGNGMSGFYVGSLTPVAVSGITTATAIAAGFHHTCAVLADGSVACWGDNILGELGNGTTTDSSTPVAVSGITTATAIAAGHSDTCVVLTGGSVDCWGYNAVGELGNGTTTNSSTPVAVSGITTATAIATTFLHTCALLAGGSVECWGENYYGELGNGTTTNSSTPAAVVAPVITQVTVNAVAASKTYGSTDPTLGYTLSGPVSGGLTGSASCTRTAGETIAGSPYTITCTPGSLAATGYSFTTGSPASFTITPAPLTVTASSDSMSYDGSVPTIAPSYSGFVAGDSATSLTTLPTCSTSATGISPVGTYVSSCAGAVDANYAISYNAGVTTVNQASQTITFGPQTTHLVDKNNQSSSFLITATGTSGLQVTFSASPANVCTVTSPTFNAGVSGATVNYAGTLGNCTITATQSGNSNFYAAPQVVQAFVFAKQLIMGPQAMEGDLKITPGPSGVTLLVGYDWTIPGSHPGETVSFLSAYVNFTYTCLNSAGKTVGSGGSFNVAITDATFTDPANSSAWYPSGVQSDPSVYQGSYTVAQSLCGVGNTVRLQQGGTFYTGVSSSGTDKVNVRWHYSANGSSGSWSGTSSVVGS
jgi:alpha-tubulin suppressor-like RCC1 family protein